jgi:hypothetical protein
MLRNWQSEWTPVRFLHFGSRCVWLQTQRRVMLRESFFLLGGCHEHQNGKHHEHDSKPQQLRFALGQPLQLGRVGGGHCGSAGTMDCPADAF